jgi:hypothetical protein
MLEAGSRQPHSSRHLPAGHGSGLARITPHRCSLTASPAAPIAPACCLLPACLPACRGALDPKAFYKKFDGTKFPKYFQIGTVVEGAADFYSGVRHGLCLVCLGNWPDPHTDSIARCSSLRCGSWRKAAGSCSCEGSWGWEAAGAALSWRVCGWLQGRHCVVAAPSRCQPSFGHSLLQAG